MFDFLFPLFALAPFLQHPRVDKVNLNLNFKQIKKLAYYNFLNMFQLLNTGN
jgi:hypothetical protein